MELIHIFYDEQEPASGRRLARESSDDEEVRLLLLRKSADALETQRDEWLLRTEPLQGARPKWNKGERPPVVHDRTGVLDLEATGGAVGRTVEHHGTPTPLVPLERQILQEAEAITPPRGGAHGPGRRQAPEPQLPPGGTRAVPQIYTDKGRQFGPTE